MRRLSLAVAVLALLASDARATVTSSTHTVSYVGSNNTVFSITFPFLSKSDITVTKTLIATGANVSPFTQGSQYTVTLPVGSTNGYVTTTAAVTSSYRITITRAVPYTQTVDFSGQGSYSAQLHENALDKLTMEIQQVIAGSAGVSQADIDTAVANHAAAADPHTGYALLVGRSGGQTLIGGTAAGNNLVLQTTSNGTKGKVLVGSSGTELVVDDVNNRVGVGTAGPTCELDVDGEVVAVANTAAAHGGTFTGNTTGNGVQGTGGATSGYGVKGIGGNPDGGGVYGQGTGASAGVTGVGGATGYGVYGQGGAGGAAGVVGAGTVNNMGVNGQGNGTGTGVEGDGGATGYGVVANADTSSPVRSTLRLVPQDANPTTPLKGDVYINTDGTFRYYTGSAWTIPGQRPLIAAGAAYTVSATTECSALVIDSTANGAITLPAISTASGCFYTLTNGAAGTCVQLIPDAGSGDVITGTVAAVTLAGAAGVHVANTAATAVKGDYLTIAPLEANAWYVIGGVGVWKAGACP